MGGVGKVHRPSTKFSRYESENLAFYIICKFIPVIQCRASTRDLLHSAMLFGIGTVSDQILQFLTNHYLLINMKLSSTIQTQTTRKKKNLKT